MVLVFQKIIDKNDYKIGIFNETLCVQPNCSKN